MCKSHLQDRMVIASHGECNTRYKLFGKKLDFTKYIIVLIIFLPDLTICLSNQKNVFALYNTGLIMLFLTFLTCLEFFVLPLSRTYASLLM